MNKPNTMAVRLSAKELSILKSVSEGRTSPRIAEQMCLSLPTIKWYRKRLLEKFEAANTAELIRKAAGQGLV